MSECKHPPARQYFWTITEVKTDGEYPVLKRGRMVVQEIMVGACCDCGEALGEKVLKEVA